MHDGQRRQTGQTRRPYFQTVVQIVASIGWLAALGCLGSASTTGQLQAAPSASAAEKLREATRAADEGQSERAVGLASEAIAADGKLAEAFYLRGRERFRLGQFPQSVADFDRYVALRPDQASRQWERGIACYYAGKFEEGAKQFELYQTFHDNDVENSVWRYLCMARVDGVERARQAILPIKNDTRVPMMEIYRLYRGELKPEDVLASVKRDNPPADVLAGRLFYARLYLGLYYEVQQDMQRARQYILLAANEHRDSRGINRYMWDVARIHARQFSDAK